MKASSMCNEYLVVLSNEEIKKLETQRLRGEIRIRNRKKAIGNFPLDLMVEELPEYQPFVELRTVPLNVYFEDAVGFKMILSREGYQMLKEKKFTSDRMYNNPSCCVDIYEEKKFQEN